MPISVSCPDCNAKYEVPDDQAGQPGQCECGATLEIPQVPESGETGEPGESAEPGQSSGSVAPGCILGCFVALLVLAILIVVFPEIWLYVLFWIAMVFG